MKKFLIRIDDAWATAEKWLLVLLILAIIALTFGQVMLRNLFSTGMELADVIIRHMVLWVGLLGASIAVKEKRHLSIDIASRLIPEKWYHLVEVLLSLVTAVVCGLLLWAAYKFSLFLYEWGTGTLEGGWALLAGGILPLAFAGMTLRFLLRIYFETAAFFEQPTLREGRDR